MLVERIPEWALTTADEASLVELLARAFDTDYGGRSFFQQRHHLRLVIREDNAVVGHMALLWRAVRLEGRLVTVAGLAEVATDPERRGKGIATTLLKAAIAEARVSPAEFLLLFGTAPLYAGAGFHKAGNRLIHLGLRDAVTGALHREPAETLMVLPLRGGAWDETAELDLLGHIF